MLLIDRINPFQLNSTIWKLWPSRKFPRRWKTELEAIVHDINSVSSLIFSQFSSLVFKDLATTANENFFFPFEADASSSSLLCCQMRHNKEVTCSLDYLRHKQILKEPPGCPKVYGKCPAWHKILLSSRPSISIEIKSSEIFNERFLNRS